jgi:type II secretory pathway component PulF
MHLYHYALLVHILLSCFLVPQFFKIFKASTTQLPTWRRMAQLRQSVTRMELRSCASYAIVQLEIVTLAELSDVLLWI